MNEKRYKTVRNTVYLTVLPIISVFQHHNITFPFDSIAEWKHLPLFLSPISVVYLANSIGLMIRNRTVWQQKMLNLTSQFCLLCFDANVLTTLVNNLLCQGYIVKFMIFVVIVYWEENNFRGTGQHFLLFICNKEISKYLSSHNHATLLCTFSSLKAWLTVFSEYHAQQ